MAHYNNVDDLPRLYSQVIPLLKTKGWEIEFAHPFYEEIVDANEFEWFSDLTERGNDFFIPTRYLNRWKTSQYCTSGCRAY
ncbi:hypothetical protein [Legionella tunisiensis]|uniref:hypothetical protein n=1 Tax=Legionella tunisiensis TaxID=1034944 RepID=UPI0002D297B1|nr:hypothetical protein [Legionella tunisiensis]